MSIAVEYTVITVALTMKCLLIGLAFWNIKIYCKYDRKACPTIFFMTIIVLLELTQVSIWAQKSIKPNNSAILWQWDGEIIQTTLSYLLKGMLGVSQIILMYHLTYYMNDHLVSKEGGQSNNWLSPVLFTTLTSCFMTVMVIVYALPLTLIGNNWDDKKRILATNQYEMLCSYGFFTVVVIALTVQTYLSYHVSKKLFNITGHNGINYFVK